MVKQATCASVFNGHCRHWSLTEAQHALAHAVARRTEEVYQEDVVRGGIKPGTGSHSSIADDGPALERLLADEGFRVVPA